MGEIATYQQQQTEPSALPTPLDNVHVSPDAEGASIGEAEQQDGNAIAEVQFAARRKAKKVAQESAYSSGLKLADDNVYNPKSGFLGKKGADAALLPGGQPNTPSPIDPYLQRLDDGLKKILADPSLDDDSRQEVAWRFDRLQKDAMRAAYTHEREESGRLHDANHAGTQDLEVQNAANNAARPSTTDDDLRAPLKNILLNAATFAKGKYGDNAPKEAIQSIALPDLQRAALGAMLAGIDSPSVTPARAQQLFNIYGDLLGSHRGAVEKAMQNIQDDDVAKAQGSAILTKATSKATGWIDPDKTQDLLKTIPESTSKGDVIAYVQKRLQQSLQMRHDQLGTHVDAVYKQAGDDNGALDITKVLPSTRAWMETYEGEKWNDIKRRAAADSVKVDNTEARAALPEERDNFITGQWLMATQPEHFASMTPQDFQMQFRDKLAPKDYRAFGSMWREQLQASAKEQPHLPPVVLDTALTVGRQAGVFPSGNQPPEKWNNQDAKSAWESLNAALVKEADQFKRKNGTAPKVDDLTKAAVNHLVGVKIAGGGLFGSDKTTTALQAEQENGGVLPSNAEVVSVPGVPSGDVQRIKGLLTGAGKAISGSSILTVYQREQQRKAGQ